MSESCCRFCDYNPCMCGRREYRSDEEEKRYIKQYELEHRRAYTDQILGESTEGVDAEIEQMQKDGEWR